MSATCEHGSTQWEGEMPSCGNRRCLLRWWVRYGIPFMVLVAGLTAVGLIIGPG